MEIKHDKSDWPEKCSTSFQMYLFVFTITLHISMSFLIKYQGRNGLPLEMNDRKHSRAEQSRAELRAAHFRNESTGNAIQPLGSRERLTWDSDFRTPRPGKTSSMYSTTVTGLQLAEFDHTDDLTFRLGMLLKDLALLVGPMGRALGGGEVSELLLVCFLTTRLCTK